MHLNEGKQGWSAHTFQHQQSRVLRRALVAVLRLPEFELGKVAHIALNAQMMDPPDLAGVAYDRHQHISAASVAGIGPAANIPAAICRRIYSAPVLMTCMTSIRSQYTSTQQYITADLCRAATRMHTLHHSSWSYRAYSHASLTLRIRRSGRPCSCAAVLHHTRLVPGC